MAESVTPKSTVYLAGPYSADPERSVISAADIGRAIMDRGYAVFSPHLHYHLWNQIHPRPYEAWMQQCLTWVLKCDVLYRMEGHSPGSDREVAVAMEAGIPVFRSMRELDVWEEFS